MPMILQSAAEKPNDFKTKFYNDVLPCNVTVVINGELKRAILCFHNCVFQMSTTISQTLF